ncbi:MAG: UbiD family decarboxylase domain-containing protein [Phycisphaerales bacterium]
MFPSVQAFVAALERAGELVRVDAPVSPVLEIAEIADRVSKSPAPHPPTRSAQRSDPRFFARGGPALLFTNVEGSRTPVLINAFGSYRRMEIALGCHDLAPGSGLPAPRVPGGFQGYADRIASLVQPQPPSSLNEALVKARELAPLLRIPPKRARAARHHVVVLTGAQVDLTTLPILKCWPLDGDLESVGWSSTANSGAEGCDLLRDPAFNGRYITFAGIHTIHADDEGAAKPRSRNIGMYRVQLLGKRRLAMHWHMHHDGARHWRSWKKKGKPMPVAIVLGGESVLPYAATAPLPPGLSEILLAGFLNGKGIPLAPCKTVPLRVPANAEIVIEGFVRTDAGYPGLSADDARTPEQLGDGAVVEGPFGDHTGFYSLPDRYPILEVTAITMRRDAIYPTTIVGLPPQEDYYLGKATERIFLPLLKTLIPDILDYDLPQFGAFHNCACLQIHKEYPLHARRVMHSVWGAGQMAWTKHIFVVDDAVDVHDTAAVLRAAGEWCDPARDVEYVNGPLDILDHAAPYFGAGTKAGFDCTPKREGEQRGDPRAITSKPRAPITPDAAAALLARVKSLDAVRDAALPDDLGRHWLFVSIDKTRAQQGRETLDAILRTLSPGERVAAKPPGEGRTPSSVPPFVIIFDAAVNVHDFDEALFHWCANTDAGRDCVLAPSRDALGFDATTKIAASGGDNANGYPARAFPPIIRMRDEIKERVDRRWSEYGLDR